MASFPCLIMHDICFPSVCFPNFINIINLSYNISSSNTFGICHFKELCVCGFRLTESGATAGLTRVNIKVPGNSTSLSTKQRESSHEYD